MLWFFFKIGLTFAAISGLFTILILICAYKGGKK